jgi:hypothetical protein
LRALVRGSARLVVKRIAKVFMRLGIGTDCLWVG